MPQTIRPSCLSEVLRHQEPGEHGSHFPLAVLLVHFGTSAVYPKEFYLAISHNHHNFDTIVCFCVHTWATSSVGILSRKKLWSAMQASTVLTPFL